MRIKGGPRRERYRSARRIPTLAFGAGSGGETLSAVTSAELGLD